MREKSITERVQAFGLKNVLAYMDSDPDRNIPKIMDWLIKVDKEGKHVAPPARAVKEILQNHENNWYKLTKSLWTDIDNGVRKKVFENFLINAGVIGTKREDKLMARHGCNIPWAILLDPTSACNLHCTGCWAAEYGNKMNMKFETMDSIINQGKDLGVYFYLYSGGEPLVRKNDIIRLCEKHSECIFLAFTNGTLIDEAFADEMLRVQNFAPAISVEGFEDETDARRGKGTFQAVVKAMEILKTKKLPFGISCCYTSHNTEIIGSEEFFDDMIERGAKFAWFFTYIPIGAGAVTELMASAEQREFMYHRLRYLRSIKPIFTLDFWNDGHYSQGCIAGGRRYLHINANGDIEPCAFIHYSDSSIYEKTILEALKSPLFMQYRKNQPFNQNHLRPCPLLDNQGHLADMVDRSGAKSTDLKNPEDVHDLCVKCKEAADKWEVTAERLWNDSTELTASLPSECAIATIG